MKQYEYVELKYEAKDVLFLMTSDYKKIINEYAENGYSYVGYIPKLIDAKGCLRKIDLIFENNQKYKDGCSIKPQPLSLMIALKSL